MVGWRSTYAEVLGEPDAPLALHKHLAPYWAAADAPQDDPGGRATRSTADPSTGAVDCEEGELVHPLHLPEDKVSEGLQDWEPHSGHGAG